MFMLDDDELEVLLTRLGMDFPAGAFGVFEGIGPVPAVDTRVTSPRRPPESPSGLPCPSAISASASSAPGSITCA